MKTVVEQKQDLRQHPRPESRRGQSLRRGHGSGKEKPAEDTAASPARRKWLSIAIGVLAIGLGSYLLYRTLSRLDPSQLADQVLSVSLARLALALCFAAASYVCLTGFDTLALRYVGKPLPYRQAALASFTSLSLGHNIGFAALSSGAVRYRFYTRWGLTTEEVAKLIVFCGVTVGLGLSTLAGLSILLQPDIAGQLTGLGPTAVTALGFLCLAATLVYVGLTSLSLGPLHIHKWSIEIPPVRYALAQVVLGVVNFSLVAACLHQALVAFHDVSFTTVATVYVTANALTLLSHVPSGLGVIESTVTHMLPHTSVIGAVLIFRFCYFLVPLSLGLLSLALSEIALKRRSD